MAVFYWSEFFQSKILPRHLVWLLGENCRIQGGDVTVDANEEVKLLCKFQNKFFFFFFFLGGGGGGGGGRVGGVRVDMNGEVKLL